MTILSDKFSVKLVGTISAILIVGQVWANDCPRPGGQASSPCAPLTGTEVGNQEVQGVVSALRGFGVGDLDAIYNALPSEAVTLCNRECFNSRFMALSGMVSSNQQPEQAIAEAHRRVMARYLEAELEHSFRRLALAMEGDVLTSSDGGHPRCTFNRLQEAQTRCGSSHFAQVLATRGLNVINLPGGSLATFADGAVTQISARLRNLRMQCPLARDTFNYSRFKQKVGSENANSQVAQILRDPETFSEIDTACGVPTQGPMASHRDCLLKTITKRMILAQTSNASERELLARMVPQSNQLAAHPLYQRTFLSVVDWGYGPLNHVFSNSAEGLRTYASVVGASTTNSTVMSSPQAHRLAQENFTQACLGLENDLVTAVCAEEMPIGRFHPALVQDALVAEFAPNGSPVHNAALAGLACEAQRTRPATELPVFLNSSSDILSNLREQGPTLTRWISGEEARPDYRGTFAGTFDRLQCTLGVEPAYGPSVALTYTQRDDYNIVPAPAPIRMPEALVAADVDANPDLQPALNQRDLSNLTNPESEPSNAPSVGGGDTAEPAPSEGSESAPRAVAQTVDAVSPLAAGASSGAIPLSPSTSVASPIATSSGGAQSSTQTVASESTSVTSASNDVPSRRESLIQQAEALEEDLEASPRELSAAETAMRDQLREQGEQLRSQASQIERLEAERERLRNPVGRAPASIASAAPVAPAAAERATEPVALAPAAPAIAAAAVPSDGSQAAAPVPQTSGAGAALATGDRRGSSGPRLVATRTRPASASGAAGTEEVTDDEANNFVESTLETLTATPDELYSRVTLVTDEATGEQMVRIAGATSGEATIIPLTSLRPDVAQRLTSVWERRITAEAARLESQTASYGELLSRLNASLGRQ